MVKHSILGLEIAELKKEDMLNLDKFPQIGLFASISAESLFKLNIIAFSRLN